jgi:ribosomal protein S20
LEYNARNRTAEKILSVITAMSDVFRVKTAEKKKDDALMTKEEYFAMLDSRIASAAKGNVIHVGNTRQKIQNFFDAL